MAQINLVDKVNFIGLLAGAPGISAATLAVGISIIIRFNCEHGWCFPSDDRLADDTGYNRRSVQRGTAWLHKRDLIIKKPGGGRSNTNSYEPHWALLKRQYDELEGRVTNASPFIIGDYAADHVRNKRMTSGVEKSDKSDAKRMTDPSPESLKVKPQKTHASAKPTYENLLNEEFYALDHWEQIKHLRKALKGQEPDYDWIHTARTQIIEETKEMPDKDYAFRLRRAAEELFDDYPYNDNDDDDGTGGFI